LGDGWQRWLIEVMDESSVAVIEVGPPIVYLALRYYYDAETTAIHN
jgi:hypothetical protein